MRIKYLFNQLNWTYLTARPKYIYFESSFNFNSDFMQIDFMILDIQIFRLFIDYEEKHVLLGILGQLFSINDKQKKFDDA